MDVATRPSAGPDAMLYFGGNADDVSLDMPDIATAFPSQAIYLLNYPGYGGSSGSPSEQTIVADALALFDRVHAEHPNVSVIGRSLGTGVAVHLASVRPVTRLVLVTPFDSLADPAAAQYPYFPIRWLVGQVRLVEICPAGLRSYPHCCRGRRQSGSTREYRTPADSVQGRNCLLRPNPGRGTQLDLGQPWLLVSTPEQIGHRMEDLALAYTGFHMTETQTARRYRFGAFEVDTATGELRRQGIRIKLNAQPFQVLSLLLDRPGELLTREQISRELWPDGTFVDYEHGVNSAVNRIREALGDTAGSPRFVETLARRGYRFVAPVERIIPADELIAPPEPASGPGQITTALDEPDADAFTSFLASPHELPRTSYPVVQTLFVLLQLMYLGFYIGALANLPEIEDLLSPLARATELYLIMIVTAGILIIVRTFIFSMVAFKAPGTQQKFLRMWPFLMPFDELWSLAPFLLLHHINFGVALACTALLVYSPFAQRALVLMGAGRPEPSVPAR